MHLNLNKREIDKYQYKMSWQDKLILLILILLSLEYVIHYYMEIGVVPRIKIYFYFIIAIILPIIIMFRNRPQPQWGLYRVLFLISILGFIGITLVHSVVNNRFSRDLVNFSIYIQILSGFFITKYDIEFFEKLFVKIAYLSFLGLAYVIFFIDLNVELAVQRGYQWTETFFYTCLYWAFIPFVILAILTKRHIKLSLIYWGGAIILNLIIVKRMILVDSFLLILVISAILFLKSGRIKNFAKLLFGLGIGYIVSTLFIGDSLKVLFDSVFNRTLEQANELSEFNRFVESINYFKSANLLELIVGGGFGATHTGLGITAEALHVGWGNFVLKGGILLLILIILPYFKVLGIVRNINKAPIKVQFSFWYLVIMFPRLFYLNMHSMDPTMLLFFYCLFNLIDYKSLRIYKSS
jgi:hypothetical protein